MAYPSSSQWNFIKINDAGVSSSGFFQVLQPNHQRLGKYTIRDQTSVAAGSVGFVAALNITMKTNETSSSTITADRDFLYDDVSTNKPLVQNDVGASTYAGAVCRQLDMFVFPLQLLVGVVGNVLNLAVLTRTPLRSSKQVYIVALAITDLIFMFVSNATSLGQGFSYLSLAYKIARTHRIAQLLPHLTQYHLNRLGGSDGWLDNFSWHVSGVVIWVMQTSVLSSDL